MLERSHTPAKVQAYAVLPTPSAAVVMRFCTSAHVDDDVNDRWIVSRKLVHSDVVAPSNPLAHQHTLSSAQVSLTRIQLHPPFLLFISKKNRRMPELNRSTNHEQTGRQSATTADQSVAATTAQLRHDARTSHEAGENLRYERLFKHLFRLQPHSARSVHSGVHVSCLLGN